MGGVFISYRVVDQSLGAAAIHAVLADRFGAEQVFRDCVSMRAGEHYPTELRKALAGADVLVAVIGPHWWDLADPRTGRRQVEQADDWVRRELAWAFQRGIPVVPVLLKDTPADAPRLRRCDLPEEIRQLADLQALDISQRRFGEDVDRLAARLVQLVPGLVIPQLFAAPAGPRPDGCAPSTLLRAEYAVVPFTGRAAELADLQAWATGPAAVAARLVTGPAGAGKNRLAQQLVGRLAAAGWLAGFVSGQAPAAQVGHTGQLDRPLLVVAADAELRTEQLVALGAALGERSAAAAPPARLLLLSRAEGTWLAALQRHRDRRVAAVFGAAGGRATVRLTAGGFDQPAQYGAARAAFAAALRLPEPATPPPDLGGCQTVLAAHAAALDSVLRAGRPPAGEPALGRIVQHDRDHGRRLAAAAGRADLEPGHLAVIAALATLCRPGSADEATALLARLPGFVGDTRYPLAEYVSWLGRLHPGRHGVNPVRPDAVGEWLVAEALAAAPATMVTLAAAGTDEQVGTALTVLGRALPDHPRLAAAVVDLIRAAPDRLILLGVDVAGRLARPEVFSRALGAAISDNTLSVDGVFALLRRLQDCGPELHPLRAAALRTYAAVFARPLAEPVRSGGGAVPGSLERLARLLPELLLDAVDGLLDPRSGRFPTGPDGRGLLPPVLLEALRKVAFEGGWLGRDAAGVDTGGGHDPDTAEPGR
jgi:hypothetical protein